MNYPFRIKNKHIWNDIIRDMTDNKYFVTNVEALTSFDVITPPNGTRKARDILTHHGCKLWFEQLRYSTETVSCECEDNNIKFLVTVVDREITK